MMSVTSFNFQRMKPFIKIYTNYIYGIYNVSSITVHLFIVELDDWGEGNVIYC